MMTKFATVGNLVSALRRLDPAIPLDTVDFEIRGILPDGRWRHLRVMDRLIRVQPEARWPIGVQVGEFCDGCMHYVGGEDPGCLLIDQPFWPGSTRAC